MVLGVVYHSDMKIVIAVLSVLLIALGGYLWLEGPTEVGYDFATSEDYERARAAGTLPAGAPLLPLCAKEIDIERSNGSISLISFTCPGTQPDDTYIAEIEYQLAWNVFLFENGTVELRRAGEY